MHPASTEHPATVHRPHRQRASFRTRLFALLTVFALLTPGLTALDVWQATPAAAQITDEQLSKGGVLRTSETKPVAPGLDLTTFSRLEEPGWNEGSVLTADLGESTLSTDLRDTGTVTGRAPLDDVMHQGPRGKEAVAAVNGTFFDINHSDAPIFTSVSSDGLRAGNSKPQPSLTIAQGRAAVQELSATGTATLPGNKKHDLAGMNTPRLEADGIGVYTSAWGDYTLDRPVGAPDEKAAQIAAAVIKDGTVTETTGIVDSLGERRVADGTQVLIGREAGAETIAQLAKGDNVEIEVGPSEDVDLGIAGSHQILTNGKVPNMQDDLATSTHPRTAVGISKDGTRLFVMVIDGRSNESRGMTLPEAGELLRNMGAHNALNLDGGGSSAMSARVAGDDGQKIWNTPSDGKVREVPNALVFYSSAKSGDTSDVQLSLGLEGEDAVFPGLTRTVKGTGLSSNLAPAEVDGTFSADAPLKVVSTKKSVARISGEERGAGKVTYSAGNMSDEARLRVLGKAIALRASEKSLSLPNTDTRAKLTLSGLDGDGQQARIETSDVKVSTTGGVEVKDDGLGTWTVRATGKTTTGKVTFTVGDLSTSVPVAYGTKDSAVWDFSDPAAFEAANDRASGEIAKADGQDGKPAIGMKYDFTTSSATRGFYLGAKKTEPVDGTAIGFSLDVNSDGNGTWPRLQVTDANGTVTNLDGDHLEKEGWQTVRFAVPDGLAQPLTVDRIRMMETRPEAQYTGDIAVSNLQVTTVPTAEGEKEPAIHDPALLAHGDVEGRPQKIAVMSDAQFIAAQPESEAVAGARRTLREIREAKPDLLIINGDFVDEGSKEDFALAKKIIDEEWDKSIPHIYVPGNHEIMGSDIGVFEQEIGAATTSQDVDGTRVITLNTAGGSLRSGGIDQIAKLEKQLDEVARDSKLTGVTVFFHHPPNDPLPTKNSQLADEREARAFEKLMADFKRKSGKSAAVINAHVGAFHGSSVEGVTYLVNGNSGKSPAGTPETGGFTGWTMLGIDPTKGKVGKNPSPQDRVDWLAAETRPWVDEISLETSRAVLLGESSQVTASFVQDGRTVPVAWPVTAQWGGEGVHIVDGSEQSEEATDENAVIRFNPVSGQITALRPGAAKLSVTVNGRTATQEVTVPVADKEQPNEPEKPGEDDREEPGKPGDGEKPEEPGDGEEPEKPGEGEKQKKPGDPEEAETPEVGDDEGTDTPGDREEPQKPGDQPGDREDTSPDSEGSDPQTEASEAKDEGNTLPRTGTEVSVVLLFALAGIGVGSVALTSTRRRGRH
ncbi:phosphodiester glycosidase family protein [Brevibacterium sp. ACRRH]|uniref:phosphodiester glycosidase family protein n=1 Tax=Brevibacterium sp. ACRRH TaxID=2918183 RepID=UPI001EF62916|nr:phosphodiester glycosidase family protein [Brevibacterium sp. ACRRH]MCG7299589.1 phosphodiester glycosidase family protein [Brevibacterium sp. ACRRH]